MMDILLPSPVYRHLTALLALGWRIRLTKHLLRNYLRNNAYYKVLICVIYPYEFECTNFLYNKLLLEGDQQEANPDDWALIVSRNSNTFSFRALFPKHDIHDFQLFFLSNTLYISMHFINLFFQKTFLNPHHPHPAKNNK